MPSAHTKLIEVPANHLLVVDDNALIHEDFRRALQHSVSARTAELDALESDLFGDPGSKSVAGQVSYRIDCASQGEDAFALVQSAIADGDPYQLAFVDMRMPPGWDGLQTIEACWSVDPNLHIVICTAYSDYSWDEIQTRLGRSDKLLILRKPFDPVEVSQLALALTEKWRLSRSAAARESELEQQVRERTAQLEEALKQDRLRLDLLEAVVEQRTTDLRHAALHDTLTGLPNRSMLSDRLSVALHRCRLDPKERFALLFLDLDDFKLVNDTLGHGAGDSLLKQVASRISQSIRSSDSERQDDGTIAARLGGDEFVVLLQGLHKFADAEAVAHRLLSVLRLPYELGDRRVRCSVSIGLTTSAGNYTDVESILRDADIAMYEAKSSKNRYTCFNAEMHRDVVARVSLEDELRTGLEAGQFELYYQPIVSLINGTLCGFESLIRWNHPTRGIVGPDLFIPLADRTGLIRPIGLWSVEQAARQSVLWQKQFPNLHVPINVNLSARQLEDDTLASEIRKRITDAGADPSRLILEITEGSLSAEKGGGERFISSLKAMNLKTYIDDFGTGYSSLGRLPRLQIDGIKIDRLFISEAGNVRKYAAIINAIVNLGRHMEANVVAEGVESLEQVALLQTLECERAQGYYFSRAVPSAEAERFFTETWTIVCPVNNPIAA